MYRGLAPRKLSNKRLTRLDLAWLGRHRRGKGWRGLVVWIHVGVASRPLLGRWAWQARSVASNVILLRLRLRLRLVSADVGTSSRRWRREVAGWRLWLACDGLPLDADVHAGHGRDQVPRILRGELLRLVLLRLMVLLLLLLLVLLLGLWRLLGLLVRVLLGLGLLLIGLMLLVLLCLLLLLILLLGLLVILLRRWQLLSG